ncbi:MAG: ABC transporter ATP-binding protein [Gammaproteobacteria bacterium]|nr:ABC transporter ATP-binding protein [Gammaproteobacteria bacterium]
MSMLVVNDLAVSYGNINAVQGVSFRVEPGELVALIGANGAGKSSTLNCLAGLLPAKRGDVQLQGQSLNRVPAHDRVAHGMALVPEGRGIFSRLTVLENLQMGAYRRDDKSVVRQELTQVFEMFPRLQERRDQLAGTLSGGEQQMVAIGRALMTKPQLLLLDEPSMGLAPLLVEQIFATVATVAKSGVAILLVEQNAQLALQLSQRAYVMENGRITLEGDSAGLLQDVRVRQAYLGE